MPKNREFHLSLCLCALVALAVAGCAAYQLQGISSTDAGIRIHLERDYFIIRVENSETDKELHVDWNSAHLRDQRGFEIPTKVVPESKLSTIYPGGKAEYQIYPGQWYFPPDERYRRRESLKRSAVIDRLYEDLGPFEIRLFVKTCRGNDCMGCPSCPNPSASWKLSVVSAKVLRSN